MQILRRLSLRWLVSRVFGFAYTNFIFSIRNFFTLTEILFWPIIGIISIGLMSKFLNLDKNLTEFLLTGVIISGVLQVSQLEVAYGILYDVWSKSVKQTFIAPVKNYDVIIGSWISGILRGFITFLLLFAISYLLFRFHIPDFKVALITLSGVFLNALIVGMTVILFIYLFGQRIDVIAWMLSVLMMLVCAIYYPIKYLPGAVRIIAEILPLTYFLEYFRVSYQFPPSFKFLLLKGFGLSIIYTFLLYQAVMKAFVRAQKTGMIVKLSE